MTMKEILFEVKGKVVGKARPRFAQGHTYTPTSTRLYERSIRQAYIQAGGGMFDGVVEIEAEVITGIQKSATKKQRLLRLSGGELAVTKPDIDNVLKIIMDALNGIAYADDSCVLAVHMLKGRYEEEPRLIVRVKDTSTFDANMSSRYMWGQI